ncbi:MAG: hypothetical protein AB7O24_30660 [Kofleriaceae bacterium]
MTREVHREQLLEWIDRSRRTQKRLAIGVAAGVVVASLLSSRGTGGGFAWLIVGIVAVCGFWITSTHIAEWKDQVRKLERP